GARSSSSRKCRARRPGKYFAGSLPTSGVAALALDSADPDSLDEVTLESKEHGDHGDSRDGGARHEHPVVGVELPLQGGQTNLHRVFRWIAQDHERKDEGVPKIGRASCRERGEV